MASFWTLRGLRRMVACYWQGETPPTNFYLAYVKATPAPTRATTTMSQLAEIAAGNGYSSGGIQLSRDSTDFDVLTEDNENFLVEQQLKDLSSTATGGSIPASGDGARYAVLTDDDETVANREVLFVFDLDGVRSVSAGQAITLRDLTMVLVSLLEAPK